MSVDKVALICRGLLQYMAAHHCVDEREGEEALEPQRGAVVGLGVRVLCVWGGRQGCTHPFACAD